MRYQDIYPSRPLRSNADQDRPFATELLTLEYFEAEPGEMPTACFEQHHILLNMKEEPHRVENFRDGVHRDFIYKQHEVVVTPAGMPSGWRWHQRSQVIVVTIDPHLLEQFAQREVGIRLTHAQLADEPQFHDPELCQAAMMLHQALQNQDLGHALIFESIARVFLVKLLNRYGKVEDLGKGAGTLSTDDYKKVLDFVAKEFHRTISVEDMAAIVHISPSHFARLFKKTLGMTPQRYIRSYRIEQSEQMLRDPQQTLTQIAFACGFADQAHYSRSFKQERGLSPSQARAQMQTP